MSFPKRIIYGTKELWNKILEEINGIKTWCDNRFVSKDSAPTDTYPVVETGSSYTTTVQADKQGLTISGPFTYFTQSSTKVIHLSPTLIIIFGTTNEINPKNNSEYSERISTPLFGKSFNIKNVLGVTLTPALSNPTSNSNMFEGGVQFISLTIDDTYNYVMHLRFVFDLIEERSGRFAFRINYICFVEIEYN